MIRRLRNQKWEHKDGKYQPVILEEHIINEIITRLWWNKIKVFRIRERIPDPRWAKNKQKLSAKGIPDLIGWAKRNLQYKCMLPHHGEPCGGNLTVVTPVPLYIEVKRPGGGRRPAQLQFIEEAKADGCIAFFAESWEDVVREFESIGISLVTAQ